MQQKVLSAEDSDSKCLALASCGTLAYASEKEIFVWRMPWQKQEYTIPFQGVVRSVEFVDGHEQLLVVAEDDNETLMLTRWDNEQRTADPVPILRSYYFGSTVS